MNTINQTFYDDSKNTSENISGSIFWGNDELLNDNSNSNNSNVTLSIENNEIISQMKQSELNNFIINVLINNENVTHLNLSDLASDRKIFNRIFKIIWKNFPLLEISRLVEKQKAINITFLWIKAINDSISKEFVDYILSRIKKNIVQNVKIKNKKNYVRVIRNNYKHLTFSTDDIWSVIKDIFAWENDKSKYIDNILSSIDDSELELILNESWNNKLSLNDAKKIVKDNLDISIGVNKIEWNRLKDRLLSFYKAEISWRLDENKKKFTENTYSFEKIKSLAARAITIENTIIRMYNWEKFIYDWIKYDIVINNILNPILIKHVRKWNNIQLENWDLELINKIKEYIKNLINWFDFIWPFTKDSQLDEIEHIEKQMLSWLFDKNLFLNNYKSTLNFQWLNTLTNSKKWLRIFIDIIDMWIMNLADFRNIAFKVINWEINYNNIDKLLKSWDSVTQKFLFLVKKILECYPECKISLWGDEIFIFIPNVDEKNKGNVIDEISNKVENLWFRWRLTSSTNTNVKIFNQLDSLSNINKIFENIIEKYFNSDLDLSKTFFLNPYITNLDIDKSLILLINNNISNIWDNIKKFIWINDINEVFLYGNTSKKLKIKKSLDWIDEIIDIEIELSYKKWIFTINIK